MNQHRVIVFYTVDGCSIEFADWVAVPEGVAFNAKPLVCSAGVFDVFRFIAAKGVYKKPTVKTVRVSGYSFGHQPVIRVGIDFVPIA